ncbi:hypothetical protein KUW19_00805 [Ferrimonas balearica]|uniref:hypothetical protein n=1 Tax=Ferrimonas balearica TaxID=44012 RepID=UPI001C97E4CC|nr:hypothetical protein [Ferrimonas balearica]MBY6105016.1 hypothetical protein [Ferrimonas balearica]
MKRFESKLDKKGLLARAPIEGANAGRLKLTPVGGSAIRCEFNTPGNYGVGFDLELALLGKEPKAYLARTAKFLAASMKKAKAERKAGSLELVQ